MDASLMPEGAGRTNEGDSEPLDSREGSATESLASASPSSAELKMEGNGIATAEHLESRLLSETPLAQSQAGTSETNCKQKRHSSASPAQQTPQDTLSKQAEPSKEVLAAALDTEVGSARDGKGAGFMPSKVEHLASSERGVGGTDSAANGHALSLGGSVLRSVDEDESDNDSDLPELAWERIRDMKDPLESAEVRRACDELHYISKADEETMVTVAASSDPGVKRLYEWYGQTNVFQFVRYVLVHCRFKLGKVDKGEAEANGTMSGSSTDFASV
jgi:hypothetical protein